MAKKSEPMQRIVFFHDSYCLEHDGEQYIFRFRNLREPATSRHAWQTKFYARTIDHVRTNIVHPAAKILHAQAVLEAMNTALETTELLIPAPFNAKKEADTARAEKIRALRDKELAELDPPKA